MFPFNRLTSDYSHLTANHLAVLYSLRVYQIRYTLFSNQLNGSLAFDSRWTTSRWLRVDHVSQGLLPVPGTRGFRHPWQIVLRRHAFPQLSWLRDSTQRSISLNDEEFLIFVSLGGTRVIILHLIGRPVGQSILYNSIADLIRFSSSPRIHLDDVDDRLQ